LIEHGRHVEIQVFADKLGNVIHLGERDCSAQRRHQKIIEESPCTVVEAGLRARMGGAAVAAAKAIGYVGAGTVEFLLAADGSFYFLEMNTRLQVEHPVTEMVTGLDLVQWQLDVAAGHPLALTQEQVRLSGHAIEVRLYAEDPASGFLPQTGEILAWLPADQLGLRVDHGLLVGVGRGQRIGSAYDPMVAKLIAHGETREQARRRMLLGLRDTVLLGPTHNKQFLIELLRHSVFVHGQVTTGFIESEPAKSLLAKTPPPEPEVVALAAVSWVEGRRDREHVRPGFPFAWHSAHHSSTTIELRCAEQRTVVRLIAQSTDSRATWRVEQKGAPAMSLTILSEDGVRVTYLQDGHRRHAHRAWTADGELQLEVGSVTRSFVEHRPHESSATSTDGTDGVIRAPTMGRVLALFVTPGTKVEPGQRLATLEAMKIESTIAAPTAGTVAEVRVQVGDQVEKRQVLVTIQPGTGREDNSTNEPAR
jgi:geranyl-CoA carboxylase alpha subunit